MSTFSDADSSADEVLPDPADADLITAEERESLYAPVYATVRSIPIGKVMTYGQVADATVGISVTARQVGSAMRYVPAGVPWQRVVGAGGYLPIIKLSPELFQRQIALLQQEGVCFLERDPGRVDMRRSQWLSVGTSLVETSMENELQAEK